MVPEVLQVRFHLAAPEVLRAPFHLAALARLGVLQVRVPEVLAAVVAPFRLAVRFHLVVPEVPKVLAALARPGVLRGLSVPQCRSLRLKLQKSASHL